ncbi:MAG: ATP-binding protein [Candidatus Acidiferrales bacterium]
MTVNSGARSGGLARQVENQTGECRPPPPAEDPPVSNTAAGGFQQSEEGTLERDAQILALIGPQDEVLVEHAPDTTILNIWAMNESLLAKPRTEMIGKKIRELFGAEFARPFEELFRRVVESGKAEHIEYSLELASGIFDGTARVTRMSNRSGAQTLWLLARDTTELRRAEERHRILSARILQTLDEERRHTSQFLHETTVQNLVALKMNLGRALRLAGSVIPQLREVLAECVGLAEVSLQEVRTLSYLLFPPILDEAGLEPALHWYAKGFSARSGIQTHAEIPEDLGRFPRDVETAIFRIVQESLGNIHRQSGSLVAFIRLARQGAEVVLEIEDQGKGMASPPGAVDLGAATPGIGIAGMGERVRQLGGQFFISSELGKGTTIRATLPAAAPETTHSPARRAASAGGGG